MQMVHLKRQRHLRYSQKIIILLCFCYIMSCFLICLLLPKKKIAFYFCLFIKYLHKFVITIFLCLFIYINTYYKYILCFLLHSSIYQRFITFLYFYLFWLNMLSFPNLVLQYYLFKKYTFITYLTYIIIPTT